MKIYIYAISKNEEQHADRFVASNTLGGTHGD